MSWSPHRTSIGSRPKGRCSSTRSCPRRAVRPAAARSAVVSTSGRPVSVLFSRARWDEIPSFPWSWSRVLLHRPYVQGWSPGRTANADRERTDPVPAGGMNYSFFSHWCIANLEELGVEEPSRLYLRRVTTSTPSRSAAAAAETTDSDEPLPFLYFWGPTNTHRTWEQVREDPLGVGARRSQRSMPAFMPETHIVREDCADYLGKQWTGD